VCVCGVFVCVCMTKKNLVCRRFLEGIYVICVSVGVCLCM